MTKLSITFGTILLVLALTSFMPLPAAQAAGGPPAPPIGGLHPPPDGGYPGFNTAEGHDALFSLTTGSGNTAIGFHTLFSNTTGTQNTANGAEAMFSNSTGTANTAIGVIALGDNTSGSRNTATGQQALFSNTSGSRNTATGYSALETNVTGDHNAAFGWTALFFNATGNLNIAVGDAAGEQLTTGNNNIDIGNIGIAAEANTIRIGTQVFTTDDFGLDHPAHTAAYIAGISGTAVSGVPVIVTSSGQLGVAASSARFKDDVIPMNGASEGILALKPVTFHYKREIDPKSIHQFGLLAEDVEKVNPDLVVRDAEGKAYTVRYDAVNAMLLNEFLKEHKRVEQQASEIQEQKDAISELKKGMNEVVAHLKQQASQIDRVSAQFELSKGTVQAIADKN